MAQSNEPTIESMNEAIALFDGGIWKEDDYGDYGFFFPDHSTRRPTAKEALKYHTSWDWLMPVIKKIKGMHLDILQQAFVLDYMHAAGKMNSGLISLDIDKAHKGVYEFLIWLNQQKQKDEEK